MLNIQRRDIYRQNCPPFCPSVRKYESMYAPLYVCMFNYKYIFYYQGSILTGSFSQVYLIDILGLLFRIYWFSFLGVPNLYSRSTSSTGSVFLGYLFHFFFFLGLHISQPITLLYSWSTYSTSSILQVYKFHWLCFLGLPIPLVLYSRSTYSTGSVFQVYQFHWLCIVSPGLPIPLVLYSRSSYSTYSVFQV